MQPTPTMPPLRKVMTRIRPTSPMPVSGAVALPPPRPAGEVPVRVPAAAEGVPLAPEDTAPGAGTGTASPGAPRGVAVPRTPGGAPPRRPGGSGVRTAAPGGRPPGSPGRSARARTRPADTRPATARPGGTARAGARAAATVPDLVPAAARRIAASAETPPTAVPAVSAAPAGTTAPVVPGRTPRRPVPQLRPTDHFAELLLDVLSGRRPVHSMLRHTVGRAYDELARLAERGPLRTRGTLPVVRDIGYYEARPGALEVFARIGAGDQLRAMAFRLEQGRDLRWRCTAVELGGHRGPQTDDD
ncbi:Rv3235 family protein [Streptomyces sp. NPDC093586]|uniref:Rv3235 family protein n=1 Tax=Streptomyces sp. NPDC093586 TaxID=3366042 RepID=UPI00381DBABD